VKPAQSASDNSPSTTVTNQSDSADEITTEKPATFGSILDQFKLESTGSESVGVTVNQRTAVVKVANNKRKTANSVTSISRTSSPAKKQKMSSKYAPPSKYAHLSGLNDIITPNLLCLLVGHNPGVRTAQTGHAYSHPSNLFWKLLYSSGITDRRCRPEEDGQMPELYSFGLTNIVARPTKDTAELSKQEQVDGTPILEDKVRLYRPEVVCIVGKSIWEAIYKHQKGKNLTKKDFSYGWQSEDHNLGRVLEGDSEFGEPWAGAKVFVTTTTSGLAASLKPAEKEAIWKPLGDWMKQRRLERSAILPEVADPVAHAASVS
jgi:TDG/mug DNA glycosylase family protein